MIKARWEGLVDFDTFSDHDRSMIGETKYEETILEDEVKGVERSILYWMENYEKNRWENQVYYPEVFIEKKALQGIFEPMCKKYNVSLGACKGYPSLTFLNEATQRFIAAEEMGKIPVILYFGDYDPSGEDIPRAIEENVKKLGCNNIEVRRFALMHEQVLSWNLPPAPVKKGDSRSGKWTGIGQVELDAVEPAKLQKLCESAILSVFDYELYSELKDEEIRERDEYRERIREFVSNL